MVLVMPNGFGVRVKRQPLGIVRYPGADQSMSTKMTIVRGMGQCRVFSL
jgi:hypothetical protein